MSLPINRKWSSLLSCVNLPLHGYLSKVAYSWNFKESINVRKVIFIFNERDNKCILQKKPFVNEQGNYSKQERLIRLGIWHLGSNIFSSSAS